MHFKTELNMTVPATFQSQDVVSMIGCVLK